MRINTFLLVLLLNKLGHITLLEVTGVMMIRAANLMH